MKILKYALISILPFNWVRILAYRMLCQYNIDQNTSIGWMSIVIANSATLTSARIGRFNYINANHLEMKNGSTIERFNRIRSIERLYMSPNSRINSSNRIFGTTENLTPFKKHEALYIGENSNITVGHLLDLSDSIILGSNVTIAGVGSQIWTHGFDAGNCKVQSPIKIKNQVYIGSRAIILPGVNICDNVSIGAGVTVSRSISESGFYVSSPIIRKPLPTANLEKVVMHNGFRFLRKSDNSLDASQ